MARCSGRATLMGFLAPLWLGALAAIVIPIVLHFRAVAPPDRIQVGSIADLTPGLATRSRPRLREWLLLALRLLFVILLTLLLARPVKRDVRVGRLVAVVPEGVDRIRDSLQLAGVPLAESPRGSREPWTLVAEAEGVVAVHDTILLVTPDAGDRYPEARARVAHVVRTVDAQDSAPQSPLPLRIRVLASEAQLEPQRDSVVALLRRAPPSVVELVERNDSTVRAVVVGSDTALGLDAASISRGALHRLGAVDSLLTRLLPPRAPAPPPSQRAPRQIGTTSSGAPSQDLRALAWWLLLGVFVIERLVASRRA